MRPLTATDIQAFWDSGAGYLAADGGEFVHLDAEAFTACERHPVAYDHATAEGREVLVLCERATLEDGDWFPDLLDDGVPRPNVLAEAAQIITRDGLLEQAMRDAVRAAEQWQDAERAATAAALRRARAVANVVDLVGGSQSEAGRLLGLDQSRINRLAKKAKAPRPTA